MAEKSADDELQLQTKSICFSQYSNVKVYGRPQMCQLTNWIGVQVSHEWYLIGIQLKLAISQLDNIKANHTLVGKNMLMFCEVMKFWESDPQTEAPFNWETILNVLASPSVGRAELAREVTEKICQLSLRRMHVEANSDDSSTTASSKYYTDADFKKMCMCGKCLPDDIIAKGCSISNALTRFPILDIKKLDPDKRQHYLFRLEEESRKLNKTFAILRDKICQSLITNKVSVKRVIGFVLRLQCLPSSDETTGISASTIRELQKKIEGAKDMDDLFIVLNKISSWFNHHPLDALLEHFPELKEHEKAYNNFLQQDMTTYLQRSITEIPKDAFGSEIEGSGEFRLKLVHPKTYEELTGNQVYYIKKCVAQNFGIKTKFLTLFSVDEGCLELKFNIPPAIYETLFFPFSEEHAQGLGEILIKGRKVTFYLSSIWYEGCYHDIPSQSKKSISSSLNPLDVNDAHLTVVEKMTHTADNDLEKATLPVCDEKASQPFNLQKKTEVPHIHVVAIIAHLQSITEAAEVALIELQTLFSEAQPFLSELDECEDFKKFQEMKELYTNFGIFFDALLKYLQSIFAIFDNAENVYHCIAKDMTQATLCTFNKEMQEAIKTTVCSYEALEEAIETLKKCYHIAESKDLKESKHDETDFNEPRRARLPTIKGEKPFLKVTQIFARLESSLFFDAQNIIATYSIEEKFTKEQILCNFSKAYECATRLRCKTGQTIREGFSEDQIKLILHTIIITPK